MKRAAAMMLAAVIAAHPVAAKDLGVRGATWPVAEPDLLEEIEARLLQMHQSGELARLEDEARTRARRRLEEPEPVAGIAPATEERSRPFDPAITVARGIRTESGTLIAASGTRVNP
ncbi:MAG: type-F conjugative transfer system protein TraW, partial [Alphaproteobacteria bacterium]|nr:type-F conjugative transfer system protein TraW [Alphaproteobacteria bacterium]